MLHANRIVRSLLSTLGLFAALSTLCGSTGCSSPGTTQDMAGPRDAASADLAMVLKDIVINEVYPHGQNELTDPDWVELKNISNSTIDLSGYRVKDEDVTASLPAGTKIPQGGYLLLYCDDVPDGAASDKIHLPFKLGGMKDAFQIVGMDGSSIDSVTWTAGTIATDKAYGRLPDGTGQFTQVKPSPGQRNGV